MRRDSYRVFTPGRIAGLELKNRLVRSATHEARMTEDGRLTPDMLDFYQSLAEGGAGLIITGYMAVMPGGKGLPRITGLYDDSYIKEIAPLAERVHRAGNGCKIIAQINHCGRQAGRDFHFADCVGPSDVPSPLLERRARVLSQEEIQEIIKRFAAAILRVKKAGYDGVQFHAAHGYLLSSFLSPYTNRRTDHYGGSIKNRVNILREIVALAREEVGDFPILIKMNADDHVPGGIDIYSFPELAQEVESAGLDALEVSGGMWDALARTEEELGFPSLPIPESRTNILAIEKQSYYLHYAAKLKVKIPVILVGGNRNIERLEEILSLGAVDFLSLSRPLICEPDLPARWREGRGADEARCTACNSCLLTLKKGPLKCVYNESKLEQKIARKLTPHLWKKVLR